MQNERHNEINKKPKLRTYVNFINIFMPENYVSASMLRSQRSLLAQIRSGILLLRLETGDSKLLEMKTLVIFKTQS